MIEKIIPYDEWSTMNTPIEPEDKRFASKFQVLESYNTLKEHDIVLMGIPQDIGIVRNGGRPGASIAPFRIREFLGKLSVFGIQHFPGSIYDAGNIDCEGRDLEDIRHDHYEILHRILQKGARAIILGGGHDIAFPNCKALLDMTETTAIVNIDPILERHFGKCWSMENHPNSWNSARKHSPLLHIIASLWNCTEEKSYHMNISGQSAIRVGNCVK